MGHSIYAAQPAISGAPPMPGFSSRPVNLRVALDENKREISTCSSARMLTAKCLACSKAASDRDAEVSDHSTSGGSSDSELKELTVRPTYSPFGATAVTTVTPVGKHASVLRSSRRSIAGADTYCPPGWATTISGESCSMLARAGKAQFAPGDVSIGRIACASKISVNGCGPKSRRRHWYDSRQFSPADWMF